MQADKLLEILIYRFRIKIKNGDLLEMMERVVMEENLPLRHTTYRFHWQEEMRMETSNPLTGLMLLDEMDVLFNNIDMNKENSHNEIETETGVTFTIPPELRKLHPARWMRDFLFDWAIIIATYCHYEHHLHPQVPYYNLPAVRKLIVGKPILPLRELFPV